MKKVLIIGLAGFFVLVLNTINVFAHCEIPCGIYDDPMRIQMINEHIITIETSMHQIITLEKTATQNYNQLNRWIMNKEEHADMLQEIVSQYFMTQRIKPEDKEYHKKLELLHQMLISAMRCKQTTDLAETKKLKKLNSEFEKLYFEK